MKIFNNPGKKLKGLAKVLFIILIAFGVLAGLACIGYGVYMMVAFSRWGAEYIGIGFGIFFGGIVYIALSVVLAWLSTISLYAKGQAVDSIESIEKKMDDFMELERQKALSVDSKLEQLIRLKRAENNAGSPNVFDAPQYQPPQEPQFDPAQSYPQEQPAYQYDPNLPVRCPNCGSIIPNGSMFCPNCGMRF